jgi:hypothetical protein
MGGAREAPHLKSSPPSPELEPAALLGPAPCDDCRHAARCQEQLLACDAFEYYARGASELKWRGVARQPSAQRYAEIFCAKAS